MSLLPFVSRFPPVCAVRFGSARLGRVCCVCCVLCVCGSSMAAEEDDALLFLIYQHLKVNGYKKAAKVLEKHITQVRSQELAAERDSVVRSGFN